jgi:uncharacterized protein with GYD domain
MATYLTSIKFTEQGIRDVGQTTKRGAAFKATAKKLGAKVVGEYWTLGDYDGLLVLEAPDDETAAAALLRLEMAGSVHTKTVRAFTAAEMDNILAKAQP